MNDKERMETIVLLNTILDEYDDHYMTGINGRAKPSHHNIWDVTEEIMDAGIPLTDEYKRKVDVYYNSLSKPTQNKRSGQYKRIKNYITEERTDFSLLKKNENLPVFLTARGIEGFEYTKSELDVPADLTADLNDIAADLAVDEAAKIERKKAAEAKKLAEEEEAKKVAEAKKLAEEEAKKVAEAKKIEEAKKLAEEEAKKVAEAKKLAEEKKAEEDKKFVEELSKLQADLAVDAAVAENEPKQLSPFEKFEDDLTELYLIRGYNDQLQNYVNGQLYFADEQKIEDYLRFARKSSKPVTVTDFEEYVAPAAVPDQNLEGVGALFEQEVGPGVAVPVPVPVPVPEVVAPEVVAPEIVAPEVGPGVADPEIIAGDLSDAGTQVSSDADLSDASTVNNDDQSKEAVSNGNLERPYIKRYHETSLKLYFQNSSLPDWDHVLEANIMSMSSELNKFERIEMMEDVIKEYGTKLFIKERKSDTLEELNELVQLQFCILRNLHIGNRSKTASIKLSELTNLANAASTSVNGSMPSKGSDQYTSQNNMQLTNEPRQQTRSEAQKHKDMDRLQHLKNLSLVPNVQKEAKNPFIKGQQDQHTLGIIPGNSTNIKANKGRTFKKGLVRLNKN